MKRRYLVIHAMAITGVLLIFSSSCGKDDNDEHRLEPGTDNSAWENNTTGKLCPAGWRTFFSPSGRIPC